MSASWKDEDIPGLIDTLDTLRSRGLDVTVLGPIVEYDGALPRLLVDGIQRNKPVAQGMRTAGIWERDQAMRRVVTSKGASYLSVYESRVPRRPLRRVCRRRHSPAVRCGPPHRQGFAGSGAKIVGLVPQSRRDQKCLELNFLATVATS